MPTVNVYVSADLKARMDAIGDTANWPAAAQEAFLAAIKAQEWRMQTDKIERLRASKVAFAEAEQASGKEDGRQWALDTADYEDLEKANRYSNALEVRIDDVTASDLAATMAILTGIYGNFSRPIPVR